ncbi:glycan-binding surface protein [Phocaeicola sartorii]|mgnify:FL=1|jgi:hypothetical protein|uniref:glycan-binding surface protein n=1 Tax=Phocaeicola sartorii TaxID=671267 RepID=UPI00248BA421|nr:glycan-binding surface protein [Phocaeicola sartorii]
MKSKFCSFIILCALLFVACEDDTNNVTQPQVMKITSTTDLETPLNACNLGDWVVVHGQGLDNVTSINVNGVEVNIRDVFREANRITLQIPRELPEGEPTNKIRVNSVDLVSEAELLVSIPDLIVTGLDNEWAIVGDTVKVCGNNFDLYDVTEDTGEVFFGNVKAKITETKADFVKVVVPVGALNGSEIKVVSRNSTVTAPVLYRDNTNLFEGFEGGFGWAGTDNLVTDGSHAGDVPPCNGKYFRINQVHDGGWYIFIANACMWPAELWANPEKWCLKFEMFTQKPFNGKFFQFDQTHYQWKPEEMGVSNTYGKWQTMILEMTDVLFEGYTQEPTSAFLFQISLQGGKAETVDIGLDNFRLYRKK